MPRESKSTVAWIRDLHRAVGHGGTCGGTDRRTDGPQAPPQDRQGLGLAGAPRHGQRRTAVEERVSELLSLLATPRH